MEAQDVVGTRKDERPKERDEDDDEWCCPITLEPLSQLPYPPFGLSPTGPAECGRSGPYKYYFDGVALATYMVSRGLFENPLTRESLTWEDCQRLDHHLETHCRRRRFLAANATSSSSFRLEDDGRFPQGVPQVSEAFALRQRIRVGSSNTQMTTDASRLELERRRLEVIRSEAVSALHGLFVYQRRRRGRRQNRNTTSEEEAHQKQPQQEVVNPHFGFHLAAPAPTSGILECDGLTIIDHDEVHEHASEASSWQQLQNEFPTLPGQQKDTSDTTIKRSTSDDRDDDAFVRVARDVAQRTRQEEEELAQELARLQDQQKQEAERKRVERLQQQATTHAQQRAAAQEERQLAAELAQARQEIEEWRQDLWRRWERQHEEAEQQTQEERAPQKQQTEKEHCVTQSCEQSLETKGSLGDHRKNDDEEDNEIGTEGGELQLPKEDRKKAKAAEKRRRARERQKAKKADEREQQRKEEEESSRRQASSKKCAACGRGILDAGFERMNHLFCTTKCARAGPSQSGAI